MAAHSAHEGQIALPTLFLTVRCIRLKTSTLCSETRRKLDRVSLQEWHCDAVFPLKAERSKKSKQGCESTTSATDALGRGIWSTSRIRIWPTKRRSILRPKLFSSSRCVNQEYHKLPFMDPCFVYMSFLFKENACLIRVAQLPCRCRSFRYEGN